MKRRWISCNTKTSFGGSPFISVCVPIRCVPPYIPAWLWSGLCLGSGDLNTSCPAHDWLLPLSPHNTKIEVSTFCGSFRNIRRLISFVDKCHNLGWTHRVKAKILFVTLCAKYFWKLPQNFIDTSYIHNPRNCSDLFQIIVPTLRNQHLFLDR